MFPLGGLMSRGNVVSSWRVGLPGAGRRPRSLLSADRPPSCPPFASSVEREGRGARPAQRIPPLPPLRPGPPQAWPGCPPRSGGRRHSAPRAARAAPGSPHGTRHLASRGSSPPAAAVMALKMVKGSIDRMFDKNLQDLVRGIRNHKEEEVSRPRGWPGPARDPDLRLVPRLPPSLSPACPRPGRRTPAPSRSLSLPPRVLKAAPDETPKVPKPRFSDTPPSPFCLGGPATGAASL